jgi:hypothetical protein
VQDEACIHIAAHDPPGGADPQRIGRMRARKADHREDAIVDDEAFVAAIVGSGPLEAVARYDIEIV